MKQTKRLMLYLFINVIVSACTILSVLWLWDRPDKPLQGLLSGQPACRGSDWSAGSQQQPRP